MKKDTKQIQGIKASDGDAESYCVDGQYTEYELTEIQGIKASDGDADSYCVDAQYSEYELA